MTESECCCCSAPTFGGGLCDDCWEERLAHEEHYKKFEEMCAAYELLIENEIDPNRANVLKELHAYYLEDNK